MNHTSVVLHCGDPLQSHFSRAGADECCGFIIDFSPSEDAILLSDFLVVRLWLYFGLIKRVPMFDSSMRAKHGIKHYRQSRASTDGSWLRLAVKETLVAVVDSKVCDSRDPPPFRLNALKKAMLTVMQPMGTRTDQCPERDLEGSACKEICVRRRTIQDAASNCDEIHCPWETKHVRSPAHRKSIYSMQCLV